MPNAIKYTTGSESLALKKGNFYIGTGDVGKGPSSGTSYYNGVTPPSSGYTVYLNNNSLPGGLSYFTADTDSLLISQTNTLFGTSYTSATECLVYYAIQTDKMVLNRDYESIVTNGLVLNLDAGFTPSYPKSGTTWYDVGVSNNGTLTNGPTFNSANGGSIVFDGSDDYVLVSDSSSLNFTTGFSCDFWVYANSGGEPMFIFQQNGNTYGGFEIYSNSGNVILFNKNGNFSLVTSSVSFIRNAWTHVACTADGTTANIYINSTNVGSKSATLPDNVDGIIKIGMWVNGYQLNGRMSIMRLYNRGLSATEVLQNYNAQKGRFGL